MPMIVDPTLVNQIHYDVKLNTDTDPINTDEKVFLLMQELYPSSKTNYDAINKY